MSSATPAPGDGATFAPVQVPEETEVPQSEGTLAPAGRIRGDASELLRAIARARITPSAKDVLLLIYEKTYSPQNGTGWVAFTMRDLAECFETWPSDIRDRLNELLGAHIIHRAPTRKGQRSLVCLRPVADWSPHVFDFAAARKRHTRAGGGAPPLVRESEPHTPLHERGEGTGTDIHDRDFTARETVEAHARERGADDNGVIAHWTVVERFQSITDQAFKPEFLDQLTTLLATNSSAAIVAAISRNQKKHHPANPWGYVKRCFENAPKTKQGDPTHDDPFTTPRQDGRERAARLRGESAAGGSVLPESTASGIASRYLDLDTATPEEVEQYFERLRDAERSPERAGASSETA